MWNKNLTQIPFNSITYEDHFNIIYCNLNANNYHIDFMNLNLWILGTVKHTDKIEGGIMPLFSIYVGSIDHFNIMYCNPNK